MRDPGSDDAPVSGLQGPVGERSMVERVAIRLAAISGYAHQDGWDAFDDHHKAKFLDLARAAIEAMREPTEGMLRASPVVGTGLNEEGGWSVNTKPAQVMWPAMIDAALAEEPK